MNNKDYLYIFRKCSSLNSLERLCDKFNYELSGSTLAQMHQAADHRRAEIVAGQLFDQGGIPSYVWASLQ